MGLMDTLFGRKKSLDVLLAEAQNDTRLRRVLGPVSLTSLGIGAIIGAGIFVATGRAAAIDAGPAIILSYVIAGIGCAFAALCYAEFAAMAPVAGSAYTYSYATLGEFFAWVIGWDLILEYAMSCAMVASAWSHYFDALLEALNFSKVPEAFALDPFSGQEQGALFNLPAVCIMAVITMILVRGIRESAIMNSVLVVIKLAVVLLVIFVGWNYVKPENWTAIPVTERRLPEQNAIDKLALEFANKELPTELQQGRLTPDQRKARNERKQEIVNFVGAEYEVERIRNQAELQVAEQEITHAEANQRVQEVLAKNKPKFAQSEHDQQIAKDVLESAREEGAKEALAKWGLLGSLGLNEWLAPIDESTRSPFMPYGFSGLMLGASIVFFSYIGFDSISTHAEEARRPQRDVPIGILVSLILCTILYVAVSAVITGMVPYYQIDVGAAVAVAFQQRALEENSEFLRWCTVLVAAGGLAGMTSVLLVTFLSQVRVFMAMSRDGLLPQFFGTVHTKYRTPHRATLLIGALVCVVAAVTPIQALTEMVNIGTLMAFVVVCAAVLILRVRRPEVHRPFRCPLIYAVAPLGMLVNLTLMLFLPLETWGRLAVWLGIGMVIYFAYGRRHSRLGKELAGTAPASPA